MSLAPPLPTRSKRWPSPRWAGWYQGSQKLRVCHSTGDRELLSVSGWGTPVLSPGQHLAQGGGRWGCKLPSPGGQSLTFFSSRGL